MSRLAAAATVALVAVGIVGAGARPAEALHLHVKLDGGLAFPLGAPQNERFAAGVGLRLAGGVALVDGWLDAQLALGYAALPGDAGTGTDLSLSAGVRLGRPRRGAGFSPWLDADAGYDRTGALNRFGWSLAIGMAFPIAARRALWVGPFARYHQIVQPSRAGFDDTDAKLLVFGVSIDFAFRRDTAPPPDRDGDGVPDADDRCPDEPGPRERGGCHAYRLITEDGDRLALAAPIAFVEGLPAIAPGSAAALDEVAAYLRGRPERRLEVEVRVAASGDAVRDQALSDGRALAIELCLVERGVAAARVTAIGRGAGEPPGVVLRLVGAAGGRR